MKKFLTICLFLFIPLITNAAAMVEDGRDFSRFKPTSYNSLGSPDSAYDQLESTEGFMSFINKTLDKAKKAGLDIGFRLIHRHGIVADDEVMLESYREVEGKPALVTQNVKYDKEKHHPASWIVDEDGLTAFEYSEDSKVAEGLSKIRENMDVWNEIISSLRESKLNHLLALSILDRTSRSVFEGAGLMLETTQLSPFMSIVQPSDKSIEDGDVIRTVWGHPIRHGCLSISACVPAGGGSSKTHVRTAYHS
jgi:hypothetical protein